MNITIQSRVSGIASGQTQLLVRPEDTIFSLIETFCLEKGIICTQNYVIRNLNDEVLMPTCSLESYEITEGDMLFLTYPKEPALEFKAWYVIAPLAFFAAVAGLIAASLMNSYNGYVPDAYGIVFDAGSTHTTMTLYSWAGSKLNNTAMPSQIYTCNMKGLLTYSSDADLMTDLKRCLGEGKDRILKGKVSTTSLYLGATGGMRVLSIKNKTLADHIMGVIDDTFSSSGLYYQKGMASIISGNEEGADAWTTTNYAENILPTKSNNIPSYGTLDLGGASTQFAVELANNSQLGSDVAFANLTLYGAGHSISVSSYLCFGQVQASTRYIAELIHGLTNTSFVVQDPCFPKGLSYRKTHDEIFDSPCSWMDPSLRPQFNESQIIVFNGTSNYEDCDARVETLFNRSTCIGYYKYDYCFEQEDLGNLHQTFMAISGFYEVITFLELNKPSLAEFLDATRELCKSSWPLSEKQLKSTNLISAKASWYCFEAVYAGKLLTNGYNFSDVSWKEYLTFENKVNGIDLGWSLGYMINATNQIAPESPKTFITTLNFSVLIVIFVLLMLVSLGFAIHAWTKFNRTRGYQRLSPVSHGYGTIDSA